MGIRSTCKRLVIVSFRVCGSFFAGRLKKARGQVYFAGMTSWMPSKSVWKKVYVTTENGDRGHLHLQLIIHSQIVSILYHIVWDDLFCKNRVIFELFQQKRAFTE
jgi:hypothetical protein